MPSFHPLLLDKSTSYLKYIQREANVQYSKLSSIYVLLFWDRVSLHSQTDLDMVCTMLGSNSQTPACLCLPSTKIKSIH